MVQAELDGTPGKFGVDTGARSSLLLCSKFCTQNKLQESRDSYDRAGLWMGQKGRQFTVVDMIAGSPAQQAGVHEGDTIFAINGEDTARLVLPDIRQSMSHRPAGSKVVLLLESQGKRRTTIIMLRDLV